LKGGALGLGATVALTCDAVVASRTAFISDPHVLVGLVAGDGGCLMFPLTMGMLRAKRYLLTGDRLGAEEAWSLGLVTDLVDTPDDAHPAAMALAQRIAALPPLAVQGTKRVLNRIVQQRYGEIGELAFALEDRSMVADDVLEAIDAWKDRRPGNFKGC
jgi:enoyl-CoA hydratase